MYETKFSNGVEITPYLATAYAEGFCEGADKPLHDVLRAWAHLIKTKMCYQLQGWFRRTAQEFINCDIINPEGIINWNKVSMLMACSN